VKLTKSKLKQIIKEEFSIALEEEGREASRIRDQITKTINTWPYPRNRVGASKAAIALLEEIRNILDAGSNVALGDEPLRPAHIGATATMPDGTIVHAKGGSQ
jgi:hypothetical protein